MAKTTGRSKLFSIPNRTQPTTRQRRALISRNDFHPDTPTVFVVVAGEVHFNVEGQQPGHCNTGCDRQYHEDDTIFL